MRSALVMLLSLLGGGCLASNAVVGQDHRAALASMPMSFVRNHGQAPPSIRYEAAGLEGTLGFSPGGVSLSIVGDDKPIRVAITFEGANRALAIEPLRPLAGKHHFLLGRDRSRWVRDAPSCDGIVYRDVYPGIDLTYEGVEGRLKGTWVLDDRIPVETIRWRYHGVTSMAIGATGDLHLRVRIGGKVVELREKAPVAWQEIEGRRVPVEVGYLLTDEGTCGFEVGTYRSDHELVIDPTLVWSTYVGGRGSDFGHAMAYRAGCVFITGYAHSEAHLVVSPPVGNPQRPWPNQRAAPATPSAQEEYGGDAGDVFVTKIDVSQTPPTLVWSTRLGGGRGWEPTRCTLPCSGPLICCTSGNCSWSCGVAETPGPWCYPPCPQPCPGGSATCTWGREEAEAIVVDGAGRVIVGGWTLSDDFPGTGAVQVPHCGPTEPVSPTYVNTFQPYHADNWNLHLRWQSECGEMAHEDGFVTSLSPDGSSIVFSTYVGGLEWDRVQGLAVDSADNVYAVGFVQNGVLVGPSTTPQTPPPGAQGVQGFLVKFSATGAYLGSTFHGGPNDDLALEVAIVEDTPGSDPGFTSVAVVSVDTATYTSWNKTLTIFDQDLTFRQFFTIGASAPVPSPLTFPEVISVTADPTTSMLWVGSTDPGGASATGPVIRRFVADEGTWYFDGAPMNLGGQFGSTFTTVSDIHADRGRVAMTGSTTSAASVPGFTSVTIDTTALPTACPNAAFPVAPFPPGTPAIINYDGTVLNIGVPPPSGMPTPTDAYVYSWTPGPFPNVLSTYVGGPGHEEGRSVIVVDPLGTGASTVLSLGSAHDAFFPVHNAVCEATQNYTVPLGGIYNGYAFGGGSSDVFLVRIDN